MSTEDFQKILNTIPVSYYDKYGILGEKGDRYVHVSTLISLMTHLTQENWKSAGNFKPVYNVFGMEIYDSNFKGFFFDEGKGAFKNIYDLIYIQRENNYQYFEFLKKIRKDFIEDGNKICGFLDFQAVGKKEKITMPVIFFFYTVLTNITADKDEAKKIFKQYYDYAYNNKHLFPDNAQPETILDKRGLKKVCNQIDTYFEKIISMVKEKTNDFQNNIEGQLTVNRLFADLILNADLEVIYGKNNVFLGIKEFKNEQFEKFTFEESINPSILNYVRKKYNNNSQKIFDAVLHIQKRIQANHSVFKNKNILIIPKEDIQMVKEIIRGDLILPNQKKVEQKLEYYKEKSTFQRYKEQDLYQTDYKKKRNHSKNLFIDAR